MHQLVELQLLDRLAVLKPVADVDVRVVAFVVVLTRLVGPQPQKNAQLVKVTRDVPRVVLPRLNRDVVLVLVLDCCLDGGSCVVGEVLALTTAQPAFKLSNSFLIEPVDRPAPTPLQQILSREIRQAKTGAVVPLVELNDRGIVTRCDAADPASDESPGVLSRGRGCCRDQKELQPAKRDGRPEQRLPRRDENSNHGKHP